MTSELIDSLRKGNRLALSRILSQVENRTETGLAALEEADQPGGCLAIAARLREFLAPYDCLDSSAL